MVRSQSRDPAKACCKTSVGLEEKRRKGGNTIGTPGLGVAMSQLGYSSPNCTCARKYPVSNCERQHEITDFQSDSNSLISSPCFFRFCLPPMKTDVVPASTVIAVV